jgi:phage-Barnase-EndoU-ColicinE5/D-RelE like nuclease2
VDAARIGVYRDAWLFHQKRTALLAGDFYSRSFDAARPRAMTVTGLHKLDSLIAVTRVIDNGIANSRTTSDIADEISAIVEKHGGTILPGSRIELIVHNALFTANAGGEWKAAMEFVDDRPFFQYRGPKDGKNSAVCKPILGLIVHHTDPILKHFWHPNHHWERQQWVTLAISEVDESTVYRSPEGYEYPVINGQVVRPADGWDFNAADAMAADDKVFIEAARGLGEQPARKIPSDYGLARIDDVDTDELPKMPRLGNPVPQGAIEQAWNTFQRTVGIENGSGAWILDYANDGVRINRDTFELALRNSQGNYSGGNGRYFPLILPTLSNPFEVWLVPTASERGTTLVKRYIGAFREARGGLQTIVLDRTHDGWLWRTVAPRNVETYRVGLLLHSGAVKG